jgi:hypothetical protein
VPTSLLAVDNAALYGLSAYGSGKLELHMPGTAFPNAVIA